MRDASPAITIESGRGVIFFWIGVAAAATAAALLYFFNPAEYGFYPRCFFKLTTGLDCPGCGGLRATHQLLHGHIREALALNPLFVVTLPIGAFFLLRVPVEKRTGRKWSRFISTTTVVWICAAIVVAFGVLRNIPWRAWFGV